MSEAAKTVADLVVGPDWLIRAGATLVFFAAVGYAAKRVIVLVVVCWAKRPRHRKRDPDSGTHYLPDQDADWLIPVAEDKPVGDASTDPRLGLKSLTWGSACRYVTNWALRQSMRSSR